MTTTSTFGWDHMHHSPRPSPNPTHNPNTTLPTTNYEEEEAGDDDDGYEVVPVPSRASIERHTPQQPPPRVMGTNLPPPPGGVSYAILEDCRDLMQIVDRLHQHYDHTQQLHHEKVMLEKVVRQQDDIIQVLEESTSSSSRLLEDSNNNTNVFEKDVVVQETTQQQLLQPPPPPPPEHVEILLQQEVKIEELLTLLEVTRAELNLYKARQSQTHDSYSQTDEVLLSSFDAVKRLEIENQELKEFMIQLQDSASSYKSQQSMQQQSYWKMFLLLKQILSSMHDSVCTNASSPMKKEKDVETDSSETEILPILQRCLHWSQQIGKYISRCQILLDNNGRTTTASTEATAVITTLSIQPVERVDTCTSTVESVQDLILQIQQLQQRMLHLTETNKSLSESLMNLQTQHSALVADTEKYKRKHKKRADEELVQFKTSTSMLLTLNKEELEELRGLAIVHKERIEKWKVNFERQQQGEQQNRTPTPSKQRRYGGGGVGVGGSTGKQQQMLLDTTLSDATTALIHNVEKNFEWLVEDASVLEVSLDRMVGRGQQIIGLFMELNLGSDDSHNKKKK